MAVNLTKRKNPSGTITLILDYRYNGKRCREFLNHLQLCKPTNAADREFNKHILQVAEAIRIAKSTELQTGAYDIEMTADNSMLVTDWMKEFIATYSKSDKRNLTGVLNRFIDFLAVKKIKKLTFRTIDPILIEDFIDYLEKHSRGEGALSYYRRFKKMLKHAYRKGYLKYNILDKVERKCFGKADKKDALTIAEIQLLSQTPINSTEVKRAALFSCVTGLAWIDVKKLTWGKIKLETRYLTFVRSKQTKYNEEISLPLNDTALTLLGEKPKDNTDLVFILPSSNGANATLKDWVKRAKIEKKITWHNLRHSFGTNLIFQNIDILTTSKLLGHSTTKQTERYVHASEEMKRLGTNMLNIKL